jgi:4-hydroxy-2-oxoheptanedioate aldolase
VLRTNHLKQKLREGQEVFGLFCSTPSPVVVEMIGLAGYDFVIIDTEHVLINPETIEHMIRAAEAVNLTALVRVPEADSGGILRALDGGAYGIVVPHIESKEQAEVIVKASRYFPQGERSLNGGRPGEFGKNSLLAYMNRANDEIMVIPMIESKQGVERIEEIASVEGIDMIMVGTADLSQSYGVPWQTQHEVVGKAVQTVCSAAVKQGIPFCAIPRKLDEIVVWREADVKAYVLGDERGIAFRALQDHLNRYGKENE